MDRSFAQQGSDTQQRRGILPGWRILHRLENWLGGLAQMMQLTEAEQRDAGVHLRHWTEEEMDAGIDPGNEREK